MMELIVTIFSAGFFATVIRTTTPLLLATLGGLIADLSGALNVALEGMMLIGCLTAVIVSVYAPWYVAVLAGIGAGALLGAIMAFFAFLDRWTPEQFMTPVWPEEMKDQNIAFCFEPERRDGVRLPAHAEDGSHLHAR